MMRKLVLAAMLPLLMAFNARPTAPLSWLSGRWVSDEGGRWAEETWSQGRGGMLLGIGQSGTGEFTSSWEYMRIDSDGEGRLRFWGSPEGRPPVAFPLVERKDAGVAFENPTHGYPTRIAYRREGDLLIATISGPGGANSKTWHYRRVRD